MFKYLYVFLLSSMISANENIEQYHKIMINYTPKDIIHT